MNETRNPGQNRTLRIASLALMLTTLTAGPAGAVNWTMNHFDAGRDGANLNETVLTPAANNVNNTTFFGKQFDRDADGEIYAEPLCVDNVVLSSGTIHQAVYVATTKNNVYCFDAEDPTQMTPLWSVNLGSPIPVGNVQCCCTDMSDWCGITGTPVIDTSTGTMYLVAATFNSATTTYTQSLHALDITSGAEKFSGPVTISATVSGVSFDPKLNHQRAALLEQGGNVYIAWSSHNDCGAYHGWIMGYNASTLAQSAAYCDTTGGSLGGIWMSGGGLVGDGTNIYTTTGNGTFDLNTGGSDSGESFLKLNGSLAVQDYFTPFNQAALTTNDLDLAGGGIMLIPGTSFLVGGGKGGVWYLVSTSSMGGYNASANACAQSFMVTNPNQALNHLHGGPVFYNNGSTSLAYTWGESDFCKAYTWGGTSFSSTTPTTESSFTDPLNSMPGGALTVSGNGTSNGIVWADAVFSGNANHNSEPGILYAFSPTNLGTVLWSSYNAQNRDDFGLFAKNPGPVVTNGHVYQATFGQHMAVYGEFPTPAGAIYEAENASLTGGAAFDNNHNNFSGTGFVDGYWNLGATTTFTVNAPVAGNYAVRVHYANSMGFNETLSLFVNGTKIQQITLPNLNSSGNWDFWGDETNVVSLNSGSNTIAYEYTSSDGGNVNLDYIELANFYEAENGTLSGGAAFANDHVSYSGTGFVAGFETVGAADAITVSVPVAGPYNVRLHYANSLNSLNQQATQTLSVYVNSSFATQIKMPDMGSWDYWGDVTSVLNLNSGSNTITYEYTSSDTAHTNLDYIAVSSAPLRSEFEALTVGAHGASDTVSNITDAKQSGGSGSQLSAAGVNSFATYTVSVLEARTYDVKVRVRTGSNEGIFQLAIAPTLTGAYTNHGGTVDLYSSSNGYALVDIGQVTFGSASTTKAFQFTMTGKNASSSGYNAVLDYLLLIPN